MSYPYPSNVREEIQTLISALATPSTLTDKAHVQAAWAVLGFGLSTFVGTDHPLMGAACENVEAQLLTELRKADGMHASGDTGAIPWNVILPLVFSLLQKWLGV